MSITTQKMRHAVLHLTLTLAAVGLGAGPALAFAQTSAAPRATPQRGTVKSIEGNNLTITSDAGQPVVITVANGARIQRLAPGSTDLKTAETAALSDVAVGDRVLVTGTAGDTPATFNAVRVILMKSGDIAQKHEAEQQDWQKRGTGGIVNGIDQATGAITVSSGARKLQVVTTPSTIYRRYADGSVKFEDARPSTLAQIHPGDQMLARGPKSESGDSLQAEEVVSGSFKNLSGTILSIDAANETISLKDLVTKRNVTVHLTPSSALHRLPPQAAAMFASRARGGASSAGGAASASSPRPGETAQGNRPGEHAGGTGRSGGGDLSQVVARLPPVALSDLHTGDAVMIVAAQSSADASNLTGITLLAGVEPILAAAPSGSAAMTLSPWSVATGAPEGGGQQ